MARVTVKYQGNDVEIFDSFGGHIFTEEELDALSDGKVIAFDAVSKKTGNPYVAIGRIGEYSYTDKKGNQRRGIGFNMDFDLVPDVCFNTPPSVFFGVDLTDEDKQALLNGERIEKEGLVSPKGNTIERAYLTWGPSEFKNGVNSICLEFPAKDE